MNDIFSFFGNLFGVPFWVPIIVFFAILIIFVLLISIVYFKISKIKPKENKEDAHD
mgnify:FL=1